MLGLHEERRQSHATRDEQVRGLGGGIWKTVAEGPKHRDARARLGGFE
jgi:hypothetical protein